jgi:hypothetical protein
MMDWIKALSGFTPEQIGAACDRYIAKEPKRRPTPADIRGFILDYRHDAQAARGDRSKLTYDELGVLENKVLPTARRWLTIPALREHGEKTLAFWGERP